MQNVISSLIKSAMLIVHPLVALTERLILDSFAVKLGAIGKFQRVIDCGNILINFDEIHDNTIDNIINTIKEPNLPIFLFLKATLPNIMQKYTNVIKYTSEHIKKIIDITIGLTCINFIILFKTVLSAKIKKLDKPHTRITADIWINDVISLEVNIEKPDCGRVNKR